MAAVVTASWLSLRLATTSLFAGSPLSGLGRCSSAISVGRSFHFLFLLFSVVLPSLLPVGASPFSRLGGFRRCFLVVCALWPPLFLGPCPFGTFVVGPRSCLSPLLLTPSLLLRRAPLMLPFWGSSLPVNLLGWACAFCSRGLHVLVAYVLSLVLPPPSFLAVF